MPTTDARGYKFPIDGERGTWWQNLIDNWTRISAHSHDGTDSVALDASDITKGSSTISAASWAATAGQSGTYQQDITMPAGYTTSTHVITFYINSGTESGDQVFPSWEKLTTSTYRIYINDNTLDLKAYYA